MPFPSLPDNVLADLDELGWVGRCDEVSVAFQDDPERVQEWLDYWLEHADSVENAAGLFRQALRSGRYPPREPDPDELRRRKYISGKYAHLIEH